MKNNKILISNKYLYIPIILIIFFVLLYLVYNDIKERAIKEFNKEQLILAETASKGIISIIEEYKKDLYFLSKQDEIINFSKSGDTLMKRFFENQKNQIDAITRVNADGIITYTFPFNKSVIGKNISNQKHVKQILLNKKTVVSDVFMSAQGFLAIAIHVPVYRNNEFNGSLAILIPIDKIGEKYLGKIKIRGSGNVWLLSEEGVEIYCTIANHKGKNFLDITQNNAIAKEFLELIKTNNYGTAKGIHQSEIKNNKIKYDIKNLCFYRTNLGNTYWTIVISYYHKDVYFELSTLRNRLILIFLLLFIIITYYFYSNARISRLLSEERKRKNIEKNLEYSEAKYKAVVDNAFEGIIIVTLDGKILFGNQSIIKILEFNSAEEIIGRNVFEFLTEDSKKKAINDFSNVAKGIDAYIAEYEGITSKGNKIWLESIGKLIDYDGQKADIVSLKDITQLKITGEDSKRKEKLIEAISNISQMLLNEDDIDIAFDRLTEIIGVASEQDRVYIIEAFINPENGNTILNQSFEWVKEGISKELHNKDFQNFDLTEYDDSFLLLFENNQYVNYLTKDLPENLKEKLEVQDIKSILLIPILIENQFWGLIGFDNCQSEYIWSNSDLDAFRSIGSIIGNFIKRKSDEQNLKDNELKYRLLAENSSDVIWTLDINGKYKYVSPSVYKLRGITANENMQESFDEALSPESTVYANELFKNAISRIKNQEKPEPVVFCMEQKCKDGSYVWTEIAISAVFNENSEFQHFLGITRNITERKREEIIKNIQFNIAKAVSEISTIKELVDIIKKELENIIKIKNFFIAFYNEANNNLSNAICYDDNEIMETWSANNSLTGIIVNENKSLLLKKADIIKLNAENKITLYGQIAECWLGIPLIANGKTFGAFVLKDYENPEAFSKKDLEILNYISQNISLAINKLKQDSELRAALIKAQESDNLKTAFLANMSHEIRTPLNGILGFANLMKDEDFEPENVNNYANIISNSGNRLMELINNILDISKIESGTNIINRKAFSPAKLIEDIANQFMIQANNNNIELKIDINENDLDMILVSDDQKINQILTNLISNALKFTSKGSIEISFRAYTDYINFRVKDSGIGIPFEEQSKIFDRFYQVNNSFSRGHEGAGLGLSLCKGLIELLDGEIYVSSEVGKGSVFNIKLPLVKAEKNNDKENVSHEYLNIKKSLTILVAEDEITNFQYIDTVLKKSGFNVLHASDGAEAVNHVKNNKEIDLILMDVKMPVLDGYSATKQIRNFNKSVRIIALTAYALSGENEKAINSGCNDYIAKPVKKESLLKIINKNIAKS